MPHPKHEEFKTQLVHDVFGRENKGKVPMEKVAMLIWQFRDDPAVVQFMAQFVAKVRSRFAACCFFAMRPIHSMLSLSPSVLRLPPSLRRHRILPPPNSPHDHPPRSLLG